MYACHLIHSRTSVWSPFCPNHRRRTQGAQSSNPPIHANSLPPMAAPPGSFGTSSPERVASGRSAVPARANGWHPALGFALTFPRNRVRPDSGRVGLDRRSRVHQSATARLRSPPTMSGQRGCASGLLENRRCTPVCHALRVHVHPVVGQLLLAQHHLAHHAGLRLNQRWFDDFKPAHHAMLKNGFRSRMTGSPSALCPRRPSVAQPVQLRPYQSSLRPLK